MVELVTQRLTLRPSEAADATEMTVMTEDFEVVRQTGSWPWPADAAFTEARCAAGFGTQGGWFLARAGGDLIGTVGVFSEGEFGYMLSRAHWGQGYATEMGRALIDHVFASGAWAALNACVFDGNPASVRVLEKLGFTEGPACRGYCTSRGGEFPTRTFTLERPRG